MKWRWRRRIKVAPGVTVNLSTTSAGVTLGGPAGRISANTSGRVTAGQSLPGTGLYSQTTLATGKKQQKQPAPPGMTAPAAKRRGCLFYAGWGLLAFFALSICGGIVNIFNGDTPAAPERAVVVDVFQETPTATNAPPTATNAPAVLATAAPAAVGAVASDNANLRSGPGTDYAVIGGAVAGDQLAPVGRNEAGDWLQLASGAWIAAALVLNAPAGLPVTAAAAIVATAEPVAPVAEPAAAQPNAFTCIGGCATPPDASCAIKGNVNSDKELIYHMPGWRDYNRTDIKPEEGDRWFCTAEEAVAAGFRAPQNP